MQTSTPVTEMPVTETTTKSKKYKERTATLTLRHKVEVISEVAEYNNSHKAHYNND